MYEDKIAAGIAFLDEHVPNWRKDIDLSYLDMNVCNKCILGQLYGMYSWGIRKLLLLPSEVLIPDINDLGFILLDRSTNHENYVQLTNEWKAALATKNTVGV